jgi:site-specific DNA-methyltransferase (adenine-specific)
MKPYYEDSYVTIYHGDCREILPELPKVDLVLTDPPWNKEATVLYDYLGQNIQPMLHDGGFCGVYTGSNFIPSVLRSFDGGGLSYCWTVCVLQLSSDLRYFKYKIHSRWRPIMLFMNGKPQGNQWMPDVVKSTRRKADHVWQEGIEPSELCVKRLSQDSVLDPFLGSGTTAVAAKKLNRKCIGIEIEEKYCEIAANRCRQMVMNLDCKDSPRIPGGNDGNDAEAQGHMPMLPG